MMTSSQIRQSFLDFFQSKQHTLVPSSSLMPDAPNLLFTNAGMNQFVPIFLGERQPDVDKWAGVVPGLATRAADTQKCIRAGGKHNDLEDVGLDTYHHTFFEMLGNWSFDDYFKQEAITWAWELVTGVWKFPKERLYATVYCPKMEIWEQQLNTVVAGVKIELAGGEFEIGGSYLFPESEALNWPDQESIRHWARLFLRDGLDPLVHIIPGNKKDNFWMMGDTGPCGPCSELHVDLTPDGDTQGRLVNAGNAACIEIWNLVFIQFNANPDGTFSPLPAKHVDTGMGFERVTSILQCTDGFATFNRTISNYDTDIFRPIFDRLEQMSGKKYTATLPREGLGTASEQQKIDVAFRVIADHIRTLSFAIADGIQPGNNDRNYVLRRILRRAVKYGRTLGFQKPFFFELVDVLAGTMGDVFPEIRAKQAHVKKVIQIEEEAFNRTLDRGIELFNEEVAKLEGMGSARVPRAGEASRRALQNTDIPTTIDPAEGARYSKRRLPHFERPWGKYMVTFTTVAKQQLSPKARDIVLDSMLHLHRQRRWQLFAACVMPDHAHALFEPQVKEQDPDGNPVFYSLTELMHSVKSFTAHEINKVEGNSGGVWEQESFDRLIRSDADLEEKFHYICRNPWDAGVVPPTEPYQWLWTAGAEGESVGEGARRDGSHGTRDACAPHVLPGAFAFRLYDEQGFPLDLTELMARERGLTVDVEGFNRLMEEQRERARRAQKKQVIELSQVECTTPTQFVGYESTCEEATVLEVIGTKEKTAVILDVSPFYAEMGGQVGDSGWLVVENYKLRDTGGPGIDSLVPRYGITVANTQKNGNTWLHILDFEDHEQDPPEVGVKLTAHVDTPRRHAIERHHTVTHLFHWALHEVVSREATQKGSYVGPDKLTFDFNCAPLTAPQLADIEKLVNERILENALVSWTEVPFADARNNSGIMQLFGEKYGDTVRVVQIGGEAGALNGYSMELCGGTHTRHTGEIGLFRITGENAIAAGVRRVEAVAGLEAWQQANRELDLIKTIASKVNTPVGELEKKIESLLAHQKELEKTLRAARQREAAQSARSLVAGAETVGGVQLIAKNLGETDGDTLQAVADALKGDFQGVVVLGGVTNGAVALVATVSPDFTKQIQAGKLIQAIAPIVGGKGGGRPDNARGGGKDASKLDEALAKVKELLGS
jgi:alanyl-tRNA synthetase/REP element-mobilizing transposase RayT